MLLSTYEKCREPTNPPASTHSKNLTSSEEQRLCVGNGEFLKELEESFVGLTVGEESTVTVTLPEDFSDGDFAGKNVEVNVTVSAIQEKSTPEITDECCYTWRLRKRGCMETGNP